MMRRDFGSTGMVITVVGVGAFAAGGWMWGGQDDDASAQALHAALDAGVNWIDTAPIYGDGKADRVVGRVLRERPAGAPKPLVFTKFGHHLVDGQRVSHGTRAQVVADCERGLTDLGVERIDLFQLHWPTADPVEETARACAELLAAGKIRAVGVCNFGVEQLAAWHATGLPLHSLQMPYSIVKPEAETTTIPWCLERAVGTLAYSPLQRGLLFGTWGADKRFPPGDHRGERADYRGPRLARALAAVEELRALAQEDDLSVPQLAIGALLCTEGLTACIVGARTAEQGALLGGLGRPLRAEQLEKVDAICGRLRADLAAIGDG
jgi:aryl-alcohol dehydrogenase-like predicted oxidoreductase